MGFAEKKVELFQIVSNADEDLTGKLIEFAKEYSSGKSRFSTEELEKFHATRQKYFSDESKAILLENAHTYIRSLKNK